MGCQDESKPNELEAGGWHIPFGDGIHKSLFGNIDDKGNLLHDGYDNELLNNPNITQEKREAIMENIHQKISTARAARLSYMTFDGEINIAKDVELHDNLLKSRHMSPFEHAARMMTNDEYVSHVKGEIETVEMDEGVNYAKVHPTDNEAGWCNNIRGFIPYRYLLEN